MLGDNKKPVQLPPMAPQAAPVSTPPAAEASTPTDKPASNWTYDTSTDQMGRGENKFARTISTNEVEFPMPYNGGSRATILLRKSVKYGFDVIFTISTGQFNYSLDDGHINVKFDGGKIMKYRVNTSDSGNSEVIFIQSSKDFLSKLRKAKTVMVEAQFYQSGAEVFTFNVAGLEWK
jgi:hypothetical protein